MITFTSVATKRAYTSSNWVSSVNYILWNLTYLCLTILDELALLFTGSPASPTHKEITQTQLLMETEDDSDNTLSLSHPDIPSSDPNTPDTPLFEPPTLIDSHLTTGDPPVQSP